MTSLLILRPGNDRAVAPGIRIAPGHRRAGLAALECVHLRGVGALLVLIVKGCADPIADQAANSGANKCSGDMSAGAPAELRANGRAAQRAKQSTCVLLGTRAHTVRAAGTSRENSTRNGHSSNFECRHLDPPKEP